MRPTCAGAAFVERQARQRREIRKTRTRSAAEAAALSAERDGMRRTVHCNRAVASGITLCVSHFAGSEEAIRERTAQTFAYDRRFRDNLIMSAVCTCVCLPPLDLLMPARNGTQIAEPFGDRISHADLSIPFVCGPANDMRPSSLFRPAPSTTRPQPVCSRHWHQHTHGVACRAELHQGAAPSTSGRWAPAATHAGVQDPCALEARTHRPHPAAWHTPQHGRPHAAQQAPGEHGLVLAARGR
jgi:hypothetical protein